MKYLFAKGSYDCIPKSLVLIDEFPSMTGKQFVLLIWLCHEANRYSNGHSHSNQEVADAVKIHINRVSWLRQQLVDLRLLRVEKAEKGYAYWLLNPATGRPVGETDTEDPSDWKPDASTDASEPVVALPAPMPEERTAPTLAPVDAGLTEEQVLKAQYEALTEKSAEEIEIGNLLRTCRKDPVLTAELKQKRAVLEAQRRDARDKAKLAYSAKAQITNPQVCTD